MRKRHSWFCFLLFLPFLFCFSKKKSQTVILFCSFKKKIIHQLQQAQAADSLNVSLIKKSVYWSRLKQKVPQEGVKLDRLAVIPLAYQ